MVGGRGQQQGAGQRIAKSDERAFGWRVLQEKRKNKSQWVEELEKRVTEKSMCYKEEGGREGGREANIKG